MLFNSIQYLFFLPIVFILYWAIFNKSIKLQNLFVILVSYMFYGWWDKKFLLLIAFTTFCSFLFGLLTEKSIQRDQIIRAKLLTATNITINLLILGICKYFNFFAESLQEAFYTIGINIHPITLDLILPVGISFYTFQALSYTIDVYRRKIHATSDITSFFAFISFFPQLVAGPIERATNLLPQFQVQRHFEYAKATDGMRQILWGLFKKIVIADNCAEFVDEVFNHYADSNYSGSTLLLAGVFFAIQIYGDFSGYSDVAIGTAKLFGIKLFDNFKTPYFSRDVSEFWKRWHISLNRWFVDYVYIPLGGSRRSKLIVCRNIFAIFLLSGLWHGANWTYVTWGAYHAVLFLPLILLGRNKRFSGIVAENRFIPTLKEILQMMTTFMLVVIGWIIFRADNIYITCNIFSHIFSSELFTWPYRYFSNRNSTLIAIVLCFVMEWINRKRKHGLDILWIKLPVVRITIYYLLVAMIVLYSGQNVTFIYFQF